MAARDIQFGELDADDLLRRLSLAIKRINELEGRPPFEFLRPKFIEAMNDIGRYGHEKYGELPRNRSLHRNPQRVTSGAIAGHAVSHFHEYRIDVLHDHFKTRRHQLAAVAFNAMMEFHFAGLESEQ